MNYEAETKKSSNGKLRSSFYWIFYNSNHEARETVRTICIMSTVLAAIMVAQFLMFGTTEATDHELQSIGGYKVTCFMLLFTMCIMALPVFIIPGLLDWNIETSTYLFLRRVEEHNLMFNKEVDKLWITDKFVKYEDYLQLGILGVVLCVSAFEIWCVYYLTLCL